MEELEELIEDADRDGSGSVDFQVVFWVEFQVVFWVDFQVAFWVDSQEVLQLALKG